jgi:EAL domain-containing protein (putative c-di-GMP-specific phosphodiesterase class I)
MKYGDTLLEAVLTPGALSVVLQPILEISNSSFRLHALECLARGPRGTNLEGADLLFDYVRRKREEKRVDELCLRSALQTSSLLPGPHKISLNVHASTLARDENLIPLLQEATSEYGIDPGRLIIEIVEHSAWWDQDALLRRLEGLRRFGAEIALDDVGLGQSNFKMILDCRPEYLKIDRYFVHGADADFHRMVLLESLTKVAQKFGARVVAEGVEEAADLTRLMSLGIDLVQGFLFSRTKSPSEILASGILTETTETSSRWSSLTTEDQYGSH